MSGKKSEESPTSSRMSTRLSERKRKAADMTSLQQPSGNGGSNSTSSLRPVPLSEASVDNKLSPNGKCAICLQAYRDPHSTVCRHIFCCTCIFNCLKVYPKCPICDQPLRKECSSSSANPIISTLMSANLSPTDVDDMIEILHKKKETLSLNIARTANTLVGVLLDSLVKKKESELEQMQRLLDIAKRDRERVKSPHVVTPTGSKPHSGGSSPSTNQSLAEMTRRIMPHSKGLEELYTELASENLQHTHPDGCDGSSYAEVHSQEAQARIGSFAEVKYYCYFIISFKFPVVSEIFKYGKVELVANVNNNLEILPRRSLVSSLEFDRDGDMFVVAGESRQMKIYNYESVVCMPDDPHLPVTVLECSSKITAVSWSSDPRRHLISSSDSSGQVAIWDVNTRKILKSYNEHDERCWTVNFNAIDPDILASGSDDGKVKIWSFNMDKSVATINAKANVCCVRFSPTNRNELIFGLADHSAHLYDIRSPSRLLKVFKGHTKAVSYVRYINENEIVSASTDSTLRVWRIDTGECVRALRGHFNEKNFVGLSGKDDHVICGSENGCVYVYYKGMSDPVVSYYIGKEKVNEGFVSSVCWKKDSDIVLVANSVGNISFLEVSYARGYNFATLEWLKNVLRNNPELAMKALCSTSSTSECASYMSSLQKYLDEEQPACIGSGAYLNGSCADNSSKSKLVGPAESKDPSASRSKMSITEDETTELDVDTDENTTTSSRTNTFERHTSVSNDSIADTADAPTGLMGRLDCDENLGSKPASKYFDRPPIAACKIPVTIVKFNGPNDILVRRGDLGFACGEMSTCITDMYDKHLSLQTKLRCSLSNAHVGCPVACHIRLVDDGDSLSEIYFDRLTLLPSGFALYPPLITRITLNMAGDNKEWNAADLALMEEVCLQKWKEANFEFSADTELGPRNFACGDLFSKDTHSSLKKALIRCIDKKVVPPKKNSVEVPTKKEKGGMSIFGIDLSDPQIETRGMKARMEKSARLEKKKSLSDSPGARK